MNKAKRIALAVVGVGLVLATSMSGVLAAPNTSAEASARVKKLVNLKKSKLLTQGCARIAPTKWVSLIFLKQPIDHDLEFKEGCDLQGHLHITQEPFQVELEVRNLDEIHHLGGKMKVDFKPQFADHIANVDVTVSNGTALDAKDAEIMTWNLTYGVTLGLDGKVKKNRGGRVKVSRYHGKSVDVTERVHFE